MRYFFIFNRNTFPDLNDSNVSFCNFGVRASELLVPVKYEAEK